MKLNDNLVKVRRYFKYKFNSLDSITPSCGQWACCPPATTYTLTGHCPFRAPLVQLHILVDEPSCSKCGLHRYTAIMSNIYPDQVLCTRISKALKLEQIIHENWTWQALVSAVSGDCSALWISTLYKYHMISSTLLLFCFCWPIDTESNKWFRSLHIISDQLWGVYDYNYCWMLGNWWLSPLKALNIQNSSQNQKKILRKAQIHQDGHTKGCYDC